MAAKEPVIMAENVRDRLKWEQGEEISRWILRVELYAASQEWDDKKTAGKAALNLPSDKLDVLLALSSEDRTSWKKIKEVLLKEFQPSKEYSEELFLARTKKDGESYLVYCKHLERLYRESFAIASDVELNEQSVEAIKRQFLRGIKTEIAQKLKLHHADESLEKLVTRAKEIEEVLYRPSSAKVHNIENNEPLQQLQSEVRELKEIVASFSHMYSNTSDTKTPSVEFVSHRERRQRQTQQGRVGSRGRGQRRTVCYSCGKPDHFAKNCPKNTLHPNQRTPNSKTIQCHTCGGLGHMAFQCPSPHLNQ